MANALSSSIGRRPPRGRSGVVQSADPGHPEKSFMGYLKALKDRDYKTVETVYKTAMSENSGKVGGYIVPQDYTTLILETIAEESFIYPRATIWPMASKDTICPKVDVETAQAAGTPPYFGGVLFSWGSEQAPPETEPSFTSLNLTAWDLLGQAVVSNLWVQDVGPAGEQALISLFAKAAAWMMEYAFLQGQGSALKMPTGIVNANATILVNRGTSGHIGVSDMSNMAAKMLPFGWRTAIWACHPSALADLTKITGFISNESPAGAEPGCIGTLLTRPVFVTDKLPALGTKGDLVFFDPRLYVIGDRQQVVIDVSDQVLFQTYQTVYRIWLRMDGKPWLDSPVTLADGTQTASGYVALN